MRYLVVLVTLVAAAPAAAQIQYRPTEPPLVTAVNEAWYQLQEPLQFAGELYYPTGPLVFFDGNTMARTGHYNGVPLYADTTLEVYSVVYLPVRRGLLQPYERRRTGDLAGTSGSRAPSFPVGMMSGPRWIPMAPSAPTQPPMPIGAISALTPEAASRPVAAIGTPAPAVPPLPPLPATTVRAPENNDGVWIQYRGQKWLSAGRAVAATSADFTQVGEYAGYPVLSRPSLDAEVIYVPTRGDLVAPYRLKR